MADGITSVVVTVLVLVMSMCVSWLPFVVAQRDDLPQCPAGFILSGGTCVVCEAGTFAPIQSTSCIPCPEGQTSGPGAYTCTAPANLAQGQLCFIFYSQLGNIDFPWSTSSNVQFYYDNTIINTSNGPAVTILYGTGIRVFTSKFGYTINTPFLISPPSSTGQSADNLLYLDDPKYTSGPEPVNYYFPLDEAGITWQFLTPIQLPGAGPLNTVSLLTLFNSTFQAIIAEGTEERIDLTGSAFASNVPGFTNTSIPASDINNVAVKVSQCQAVINEFNGIVSYVRPVPYQNVGPLYNYSYYITDGTTYSVAVNLLITASTLTNLLTTPAQIIYNATGLRTYVYLPTGETLVSSVSGLSTALPGPSQHWYPLALKDSNPGSYTMDTAPFLDSQGMEYTVSPQVPVNGLPPGSGTLYAAVNVYINASQNIDPFLTEQGYLYEPNLLSQVQTVVVLPF